MSTLRKNKHPKSSSPAALSAARPYDRQEQLPRLIGLWPAELQDVSAAGTSKILALLRKALRSERSRGRGGHWSYDLNRHLALAEALKAERAHLRGLEAAPGKSGRLAKQTGAVRNGRILHLPALAGERAVPNAGPTRAASSRSAGVFVAELGGIQLISDADRQGHIVA